MLPELEGGGTAGVVSIPVVNTLSWTQNTGRTCFQSKDKVPLWSLPGREGFGGSWPFTGLPRLSRTGRVLASPLPLLPHPVPDREASLYLLILWVKSATASLG